MNQISYHNTTTANVCMIFLSTEIRSEPLRIRCPSQEARDRPAAVHDAAAQRAVQTADVSVSSVSVALCRAAGALSGQSRAVSIKHAATVPLCHWGRHSTAAGCRCTHVTWPRSSVCFSLQTLPHTTHSLRTPLRALQLPDQPQPAELESGAMTDAPKEGQSVVGFLQRDSI